MSFSCCLLLSAQGSEEAHEREQQFLFFLEEGYMQEFEEHQISLQTLSYNELTDVEDGEQTITDSSEVLLEWEYGITEWLAVEIEMPYLWVDVQESDETLEASGLGDMEVATVFRMSEEGDKMPAMAISFEAALPTGDDDSGLGSGEFGWGVALNLSKHLGSGLYLHSNVGWEFTDGATEDEESVDEQELFIGLAAAWIIQENLTLLLEYFIEEEEETGDDEIEKSTAAYLAPAMVWTFENEIELGVTYAMGLSDDSFDSIFGIRASVEF